MTDVVSLIRGGVMLLLLTMYAAAFIGRSDLVGLLLRQKFDTKANYKRLVFFNKLLGVTNAAMALWIGFYLSIVNSISILYQQATVGGVPVLVTITSTTMMFFGPVLSYYILWGFAKDQFTYANRIKIAHGI